ncbi:MULTISPECIES: DUF3606 domain-containing protein [Pseudomonas]|jgi:hypothetical protein|uniref:DUF3606 domain-containing protein n=1 Tax=Pseudomonas TaxID=286 RepID=UPI0009F2314F|nr:MULTISPECIES: DUF3606 domain-containing protein [Pseudomonas]
MSDNKHITHPADAKRIDVNDPNEVRNWCASFRCTETQLKNAVAAVGTWSHHVRDYFNK